MAQKTPGGWPARASALAAMIEVNREWSALEVVGTRPEVRGGIDPGAARGQTNE